MFRKILNKVANFLDYIQGPFLPKETRGPQIITEIITDPRKERENGYNKPATASRGARKRAAKMKQAGKGPYSINDLPFYKEDSR